MVKDEGRNQSKRSSRRRKKRRTEVSSSESSSDSSSDESADKETVNLKEINSLGENNDQTNQSTNTVEETQKDNSVNHSATNSNSRSITRNITLGDYLEDEEDSYNELSKEAKDDIKKLNEISGYKSSEKLNVDVIQQRQTDFKQIQSRVKKAGLPKQKKLASEEVLDEYLNLMMETYEGDLDKLRTAKDLSEFSLPILAQIMKEGGNVFDYQSVLNK